MKLRQLAAMTMAIASIVGCSPGVNAGAPPQPARSAAESVVPSWTSPKADEVPNLLYVSSPTNVAIYTYENGQDIKLVGELTGFRTPEGLCTDRDGNVFIADGAARKIYEYAHGGVKPLRIITRSTGYPYSCAVDPNTNDLAISIEHPHGKYQEFADVIIYQDEVGSPKTYSSYSGLYQTYFLAYDNKSNLYLDASPCVPYCYEGGGPPELFVLSSGGTLFQQVQLSGLNLYDPTGIVWVNPSLLIADNNFEGNGTTGAYKVVVTPSGGALKGSLDFTGTAKTYGLTVRAGQVLVPDQGSDTFRIYSLSNGTLEASFTKGIATPFAAVISQKT
jgi:hypothetical protein